MVQKIALLGATGSIGRSTLDVVSLYPDRYEIYALTAGSRVDELVRLCAKWQPKMAVIADESRYAELAQKLLDAGLSHVTPMAGSAALCEIVSLPQVDVAVLAIVGAAGLAPTFAAAKAGKRLLLANKESVVCGGELLMRTVKACHAELLPVDSEHNAIFQCLASATPAARAGARLILTASGGPFRHRYDLENVTPAQACAHPNWSMGQKISVDSATLMNKGLEVIEASWLFGFTPDQIDVVVHPQSIIHSMVEYADGCVLAQMGTPDMKTPIAYSLGWPERLDGGSGRLDFTKMRDMTFEAPDLERFPQLAYAYETLRSGGAASIVLNAANEIAVEAFLKNKIGFLDIARTCRTMMDTYQPSAATTLEDILAIDLEARRRTREVIA
ncbi:MAG: 1-deoxy-D-xylulose-5-phosphate reductoisomerase [Burkholderiaceae bacterium]|nr:1-deoxy-D-xylulose-5-phosphate reductoisomerase [Burkholderiaceae bacterium]